MEISILFFNPSLRFVLLIRTHAEEANLLETKSTQTPNKEKMKHNIFGPL